MSFTESLDKIVEDNRNQLVGKHPTWGRVRLVDVASILNGFPFESHRFTTNSLKGQPLIRIRDVLRSVTNTYYEGEFDPAFLVRSGDLLVGMDGDFNSAIWRGDPGLLNQRVCKIVPLSRSLDGRFLTYCLPGYFSTINAQTSSITVKHLSSRTIADIPLPLPPLAEQSRIADALDELFSDLDAGVAALERVREKLKLYHASVLKAAVEGALTAEWRAQPPYTEPATELLKRVLAERRRRWEEDQLVKFKAKGQEPPKNWKAKYKEPVAPDTSNLPPLPERWCWSSLDQNSSLVTSGSRAWKDYYANDGAVFIRSQDIRTDRLELDNPAHVAPPKNAEGTRTQVCYGDLLVTITGANVAKAAIVKVPLSEAYVSQHVGLIRLVLPTLGKFIHIYAVAPSGGRKRLLVAAYGAGKPGLNLDNLRELAIPLPPFKQAEAIVESVEDQLSVIDHLETDLDANVKSAQALRQAILRHAFTGQLVPQDPNDEPASELVKRIAAEREARARVSVRKADGVRKRMRRASRGGRLPA